MRKPRYLLVAIFRPLWPWLWGGYDPGNRTCTAIRTGTRRPCLSFAGEEHIRSQHLPEGSIKQTRWASRCPSFGPRRSSITRRHQIRRGGAARVGWPRGVACRCHLCGWTLCRYDCHDEGFFLARVRNSCSTRWTRVFVVWYIHTAHVKVNVCVHRYSI